MIRFHFNSDGTYGKHTIDDYWKVGADIHAIQKLVNTLKEKTKNAQDFLCNIGNSDESLSVGVVDYRVCRMNQPSDSVVTCEIKRRNVDLKPDPYPNSEDWSKAVQVFLNESS